MHSASTAASVSEMSSRAKIASSCCDTIVRRSATGIKRMSVRNAKDNFQVEKGDPIQSIYILTAIRIPTDSALLTRIWFFNYNKQNFRESFKDEVRLRQEILDNRDTLLSFCVQLLAETFKLHAEANWPDLSGYEPVAAPRTQLAQRVLLQCLRAYERLSDYSGPNHGGL